MKKLTPGSAGVSPAQDSADNRAARLLRANRAAAWNRADLPEWRSRGYLPHFDGSEIVQMVTFRLADSLPAEVLEQMRRVPSLKNDAQRRVRAEAYLDAGHGACYLRNPKIAMMAECALLHFHGERYRMVAWSIMPNHVHVLFETFPAHPLAEVLHSWKSFTSHEANRMLRRSGVFWETEYWDRYIRDEKHLANAIRYIEVKNPSRYSSARWQAGRLRSQERRHDAS